MTRRLPDRLALVAIRKRFGEVLAADGASVAISAGEVHGLIGENGAGKTTLANLASGMYRPDSGSVLVDGEPVRFRTPLDALDAGVTMVHQDLLLVENLTAAENIRLGSRIRRAAVDRLVDQYELPVRLDAPVWSMERAERQQVAILTALAHSCRLLILDEPTSSLAPAQAERLLATVRRLADAGVSVLLVTHRLEEMLGVCDRVTVLRQGRAVGTFDRAEVDPDRLVALMLGPMANEPPATGSVARAAAGGPALRIEGLRVAGAHGEVAVDGVSLEVRGGEIFGIAGVAGNGQKELVEALIGLRTPAAGWIDLPGGDGARLGCVPPDPRGSALADRLSLTANVGLRHYRSDTRRPGFVDHDRLRARTAGLIAEFGVRGAGPDGTVAELSGGNLQRLIIGRELSLGARALIVMNPCTGLDVGGARFVADRLRGERDRGAAVLLVSDDLDEILRLSDRIAVLYRGRIRCLDDRAAATPAALGQLMTRASSS